MIEGGEETGRRRGAGVRVAMGMCLLVLVWVASAAAQQGPLEPYVEEAVRANLGLRQERLAAERSGAAVGEARANLLPSLSLNARYSEAAGVLNLGDLVNPAYRALNQLTGSGAFPTDIDAQLPFRQETTLRLAQPLFNRAIAEGYRIARRAESLQREQLGAATRRLAADVQTAYLDHARASRVVDLYRNTLPLLDENLRVNERLLAAGRVTPDAIFRARAERSAVEQQLAEAEGRREAARQAFNLLLDRPLDTPLDLLPDSLLVPSGHVALDEALARARAGREELRQADHGIAIAEGQRRLARASYLPTVAVALDYGIQGRDYRWDRDSDFASPRWCCSGTPSAAAATPRAAGRRRWSGSAPAPAAPRRSGGSRCRWRPRTAPPGSRAAPWPPPRTASSPPAAPLSWSPAATRRGWPRRSSFSTPASPTRAPS
jgi:outer membrane protein TolC